MSLLAMILAAQQSAGPAPAPADPRPPAPDEHTALIRPSGRVIFTANLAPDGSGDYPTITAAIAAARTAQADRMKVDGFTTATPDFACQFILAPGTYDECIVHPPPFSAFYGAGRDVTIVRGKQDDTNSRGIHESAGRVYVEGLTLRRTVAGSGGQSVYPVHASNRGTTIYAHCHLDNAAGGTWYGMDGYEGGFLYLYSVTGTGTGTNLHGWANMVTPETIVYHRVTTPGILNYNALSATTPSEVWVKDCAASEVQVSGNAMTVHVSGSSIPKRTIAGTQTTRSDPPVPVGGLSPADRAHYGM